ncbi:hypothetical protein ACRRTK_023642 [Alexandromys fortis]
MAVLVRLNPYVSVSSLLVCKCHTVPVTQGTNKCVFCAAHQDMFSWPASCSPPASRRSGWWCC